MMKKVMNVSGWTDYPFLELGDEEQKEAPIRQVNVQSFNGYRHAIVTFIDNSFQLELPVAYLFRSRGRSGQVKQVNPRKLARQFGMPTRRL